MDNDASDTEPALRDVLDEWSESRLEHRYVHQDTQCDNCLDVITRVRYRCKACDDFDLCASCFALTNVDRLRHDPLHEFYPIQYFRLDVPPTKGEDLTMIHKFLEDGSHDNFFLHYPWLFNSHIFDKLIADTTNEETYRALIHGILAGLDEDEAALELDSIIRNHAPDDWNHRAVFDEVGDVARLQECRAEGSQYFASVWQRLSKGLQEQTSVPPESYTEQRKAALKLSLEDRDFEDVSKILSTYCKEREDEWSHQASGVMTNNMTSRASNFYNLVFTKEAPVETDPDRELSRTIQTSQHPLQLSNDIEVLLKDRRVVTGTGEALLCEIRLDDIPRDHNLRGMRTNAEVMLLQSRCQVFAGNFAGALASVDAAKLPRTSIILNRIHIFLSQGQLAQAKDAAGELDTAMSTEPDFDACVAAQLFIQCFTGGAWLQALQKTLELLEKLITAERPPTTARLQTELFCHRILDATRLDIGSSLDDLMLQLLQRRYYSLLDRSLELQRPELAFEIFRLLLGIHRTPCAVYELDSSDYLTDTDDFSVDPAAAYDLCQEFISKTAVDESDDSYHILLGMASGTARVALVEALASSIDSEPWRTICTELLSRAQHVFAWTNCRLGLMQASLLQLHLGKESTTSPHDWQEVKKALEEMEFVPGLVRLVELEAVHDLQVKDLQTTATTPQVQKQLLPLLQRSGNDLEYRKAQLQSMTSWLQGPTFMLVCERTFHPTRGFQSDHLALIASRILCRLYNTNNNFQEAYVYALLSLRYAISRSGAMVMQRMATRLFLEALANVTSTMSDPARIEELTNLAAIWDKWVYIKFKSALAGFEAGQACFSWHEIDFETLLWPAKMVACNIEERSEVQLQTRSLMLTLKASLNVACDLVLLAPPQLKESYAASVLHALGIAAEHIGNPILALQLYDHAKEQWQQCRGLVEAHGLQLQIARRLDSLLWTARPLFIDFLPVCQTYLADAETFFWKERTMQSSYQNALIASSVLSRSHLRCVHYSIDDVDWGEDDDAESLGEDQKAEKTQLEDDCVQAERSVRKAMTGTLQLRKQLAKMPPFQALENSRLLYFGQMEELNWTHMGIKMSQSRVTEDIFPLFDAVQQWKAISLVEVMSHALTVSDVDYVIDELDRSDSQEQHGDVLESIDELVDDFSTATVVDEDGIYAMAEIAEQCLREPQHIVFVEYARYHDTLFLAAFNGSTSGFKKCVIEFDYWKIEKWVKDNLGVESLQQGQVQRKRLMRMGLLEELRPLLQPLEGFVKPEDLVVLCSAGILHALPLHAIPFGKNLQPLIVSNPVVYCASSSVLRNCVSKASESRKEDAPTVRAAAFSRIGPEDLREEGRMEEIAAIAMQHFYESKLLAGRNATRSEFLEIAKGLDLLHYHGHAYLEATERKNRALVLESSRTTEDNGHVTAMDIFGLQLNAALVVLLACASGEDDIAPNNDPLGLLSAFIYAGASSIIGTLWPTQTEDARIFTSKFYEHAFGIVTAGGASESVRRTVYLAKALQQAVKEMWEDRDEDEPYHWAQFVLHGSWFYNLGRF